MRTASGQLTVVNMNDGGSELYVRFSSSFGTLPMDNNGLALSDLNQYDIKAAIYYGTEAQTITKAEAKAIDDDVWIKGATLSSEVTYPLPISGDGKSVSCIIEAGGSNWVNDNPWVDFTLQCAKGTVTARFNIFGQRAGNTGTSVKVQYSSDARSWHTSFTENDVWMRVSSSDGTWGSPIRVVGEKGDGGAWTEYSYNISARLTTSGVNSAPSDIAAWYDAPIAATSDKPYLWMRVQKYTDTDTKDGAPTYLRLTGEKGADGTSVNIKGYVNGWAADAASIVTNHKLTQWAIDNPHGLYVPYTETLKNVGEGDGYLIKADLQDTPSDNEGHLIVSSGGTWLDCGKITGEKGDDGKTMYLHIAYSDSLDGSKNFTTDDDGGKIRSFIGTYADFTQADSSNYKKYYWKPYKGEKGDDALYIVCDGGGETYPADADGNATSYTTHTVTAELYYGTKALTDYTVEVSSADDNDWYTAETLEDMAGDVYVSSITRSGTKCIIVFQVGESNFSDNNAYIRFRLSCSYGIREKQVNCFAQKKGADATYIETSPSNLILEQNISDSLAQSSNNFNVNLSSAKFQVRQVTAGIATNITSQAQVTYDSSILTLALEGGYYKITRIKSLSKHTEVTVSYGNYSVILPVYINTVGTWAQNIKGDTMEAISNKEWTAIDADGVLRSYNMESLVKQAADGLLSKAYKTIEVKTVNNTISIKENQQSYTEYELTTAADSNINVLLSAEIQASGDNSHVVIQLTGKKGDMTEWVSSSSLITDSGQHELSFSDEVVPLTDVHLRFLCRNCTATVTIMRLSQGLSSYIKQTAESVTIDAANVNISNGGNLAAIFQEGSLLLNKAFACPRKDDGTYDTSHPTVSVDGNTGAFTCHNGEFSGALQASTIGYAMNAPSLLTNNITNKKCAFQIYGGEVDDAVVSCLTVDSSIYIINSNRAFLTALEEEERETWGYNNIIWALPPSEKVGNRMLDLYFVGINIGLQSSAYQVYLAIGDIDSSDQTTSKNGIYVSSTEGANINIMWPALGIGDYYFYNPSYYNFNGNYTWGLSNFLPLRAINSNGKYGQLPRHIRLMSLNNNGKWNWYILEVD